jgi:hypothetical protein
MRATGITVRVALVSAALAALGLAGCSSAHAINTGPFGDGYSPGANCGVVSPGGVASYGVEELRNIGADTAVVERVSLTDPHHLIIKAAWVVPLNGPNAYGFQRGWPPKVLDPGVEWSRRQRAVGARVPRAHGQHSANLVLVLKPVGRDGRARAVDVFYRESGQHYHLRYNTSVELKVAKSC